jgi:hypothetical protein
MVVRFSTFQVTESRNRKSCRWCGTRCFVGITIRCPNRRGIEVIRGFCCQACAEKVGNFASQTKLSGEQGS